MRYSVCGVGVAPGQSNAALERLASVRLEGGMLVGCWNCEIGRLNRILLIHAFEHDEALAAAQGSTLEGGNPFGIGEIATSIELDTYAMFPGVSFMPAGRYGAFYEVRTYQLKRGGLAATFDAWNKVLDKRTGISPLSAVMYALNGNVPRFMHIWPYANLDERMSRRAKAVEAGVWPPPGGLPHIESMRSEIFLPAPFSPLR